MFAVRTAGDPLRFVNAIRGQVAAIDPNQTITAVKTMSDVVEGSEQQRQSVLVLLGSFASAGLLLAMIGIYGVIAYSVAQRAKEVGIRRSLGAQNQDILQLILGKGLALAMTGAALGVAAAVALTRLLQSLLFEISATDPATFLAVTLLLVCAALLASYLPARRAVRLEPSEVLRSE
jgi:ABC-type antimicrobial peptide transport system permease subunit